MYVKKISDEQFLFDCVNKEFEVANTGLHFETMEQLKEYAKEHQSWFSDFELTEEQYKEWKSFFMEHFYKWKPKSYPKKVAEREFAWFNLQYGFPIKEEKNN